MNIYNFRSSSESSSLATRQFSIECSGLFENVINTAGWAFLELDTCNIQALVQ